MKFLIPALLLFSSVAKAEAPTIFLCQSESPRGSIALSLSVDGPSIGRQSNPYTREPEALLAADKDQYDNLFVKHVEKNADGGFTFNASVYSISNNRQVLDLTKSHIKLVKKSYRMEFFIGDQRWMEMSCVKKKAMQ